MQERGCEFGRPQAGGAVAAGWNLVAVKDAARLNGLTSLCVTKLDVLTGLKTLKIGVAYELDGKRVESMPASLKGLSRCVPVYEELPGWHEDIASARKWNDLPAAARNYLKRIEQGVEVLSPLSLWARSGRIHHIERSFHEPDSIGWALIPCLTPQVCSAVQGPRYKVQGSDRIVFPLHRVPCALHLSFIYAHLRQNI